MSACVWILCWQKFADAPHVLGQVRRQEVDKGKPLAGKSTLNRLELGARRQSRLHKMELHAPEMDALLLKMGVQAIPRRSDVIIPDFDATDDRIHGNQEGRFYHGYYGDYCCLPLYCFCGDIPLWAQLRTSGRDASDGTVEAMPSGPVSVDPQYFARDAEPAL